MRYENPIRTLGDYSKPSHEGYWNIIDAALERTRLRLFQFSLRDQASNWLERLLAGSITTWEDLTTRFLAQFFLSRRTAKLRNNILMFQQHHGESLSEAWTRFKDLLQKVPHHGVDLWLQNDPRDFAKPIKAIALPQDVPSTFDCRLIELETQVQRLMEAYLAPTQPTQVNKITTSCEICNGPHDTQYCMEDPEQAFVEYASSRTDEAGGEMTNKIDTVLKAITDQIAGTLPSDTVKNLKLGTRPVLSARSYLIMDPQCSTQIHSSINAITIHSKQQSDSHDRTKENEEEERGSPENHPDSPTPPDPSISFITEKVLKFNSLFESLGLVPPSPNAELVCTKEEDDDVMFIEIIPKDDNSNKEEPKSGVQEVEYFDTFPTRSELAYHKYLMCGPIPLIFLRNPIIIEGYPSNLKMPRNIGHVHVEKAYIDLNSPLNIMTRMIIIYPM
ncbi:MAK10-like protein [Tanacetum coccineum]